MNEAEILAMIKELNTIEVRGEQNLDTLLTIIRLLQDRARALRDERLRAMQRPSPSAEELSSILKQVEEGTLKEGNSDG